MRSRLMYKYYSFMYVSVDLRVSMCMCVFECIVRACVHGTHPRVASEQQYTQQYACETKWSFQIQTPPRTAVRNTYNCDVVLLIKQARACSHKHTYIIATPYTHAHIAPYFCYINAFTANSIYSTRTTFVQFYCMFCVQSVMFAHNKYARNNFRACVYRTELNGS